MLGDADWPSSSRRRSTRSDRRGLGQDAGQHPAVRSSIGAFPVRRGLLCAGENVDAGQEIRLSGDAVTEQDLAFILPGELGLIGFVRLEASEILDGRGQAGTFLQVAGYLLVMDRLSPADGKVDHGSQGQGRGERVSGRQGVGGWDQDVIEDSFEVRRLFDRQCGGPVQGRPIYQEGQGAHRAAGLLDVVEGLFLGVDVVEIGKFPQIRPEMGRRQGTLETGPSEYLGLIGPPERFQCIDPGVLAGESVPCRISVVIVFGRIHSLQGFLGSARRQEPAGNRGGDRGLLPVGFVNLVDEGIDIALGVGNILQGRAGRLEPQALRRLGFDVCAPVAPVNFPPVRFRQLYGRRVRIFGHQLLQTLQPFVAQHRHQRTDETVVLAVGVLGQRLEGPLRELVRIGAG